MKKIQLIPYIFSVRENYNGKNSHSVDDRTFVLGDINEHDVLDKVKNAFQTLQARFGLDELSKKVWTLSTTNFFDYRDKSPVNRFMSGIIESGEYGTRRNTCDVSAMKAKEPLGPNIAVLDQYYFIAYFPAGQKKGIMLIQSGLKSSIDNAFEKEFEGLIPDLSPAANTEAFDSLYNNKVFSKISGVMVKKSSDKFSNDPQSVSVNNDAYKIKIDITPVKDESILNIFSLIKGGEKLPEILEFPPEYDINDLKATVKYGKNSQATFSIENNNIVPRVDITEEISYCANTGFPTFNSLNKASFPIVKLFSKKLKIHREITDVFED
jgi:hypothetical protein